MKKSYSKLMAAGFLVLVSIILMVTVSYAWFTMAESPALTGVQINIGGDNTIKIAADIVQEVDGQIVHYPGEFKKEFNIGEDSNYLYLQNLSGLQPVSTADGIHWFMPSSDVNMGVNTSLKLSDYICDNTLSNANLSVSAVSGEEDGVQGSYVYIDFWVVSPMDYCNLRVSISDQGDGQGSYLINLPKVVEDHSVETGYSLDEEDDDASACARVGFLINTEDVTEDTPMVLYSETDIYQRQYSKLKGIYQEPGETVEDVSAYKFTIYEPNADKHSGTGVSYVQTNTGLKYITCKDGQYVVTSPIGLVNDKVVLKDISDILAVQKTNQWTQTETGESLISQVFQTAIINRDLSNLDAETIEQGFYNELLQNNYAAYVDCATFFEDTDELYFYGDGTVTTQDDMKYLSEATASENAVIVSLERNVPQRIRMYVWLEGQDVDCAREAALERFALGIELAGSTRD